MTHIWTKKGRKKLKKLLVYLKDYKKESILGPLFKLLEASFELIVPLVVASMIDVGIAQGDKGYVGRMYGFAGRSLCAGRKRRPGCHAG